MNTQTVFRTKPLMPNFGVEILDVDVTKAEPDELAAVVDTFHRNGALVLRGQVMSQQQQLAFTRLFGAPEGNSRLEFCDPDYPEIYVISNKVVNGRAIGDPEAGIGWHTDFAYGAHPAMCTILHAQEVPAEGSDTLLADLCAAWNALPPERQEELDGLVVHHSFAQLMRKRNAPMTRQQKEDLPDVFHPLIRRHPADGRKALYVSGTTKGILNIANPDGIEMMEELIRYATQDCFVYRHKWRVGDILVWDNRVTLHTGTLFDKTRYIRHCHRTWVTGEAPIGAVAPASATGRALQ